MDGVEAVSDGPRPVVEHVDDGNSVLDSEGEVEIGPAVAGTVREAADDGRCYHPPVRLGQTEHVVAGTVQFDSRGATWRGGATRVPGTIRDLVDARLAVLDEPARTVVVAGAVVGTFEPSMMRAITEADDALIAAALSAGVRAGLLETTSGSLVFRHAIIREAVLDTAVPHLVEERARAGRAGGGVPGYGNLGAVHGRSAST